MPSVSQVLKEFGPAYIAQFGPRMTAQQKKVLLAVIACRDARLGTIRYRCGDCGAEHTVPRSCCNRHCSACQWARQKQWLSRQTRLLLPCHYFLITFTLPKELRELALRNPAIVYAALMKASAWALKSCAQNPRFVGATETGFVSVLHTWGRDLTYHPHVHVLVPGGGISEPGQWCESRVSVFVPEQVLEAAFHGKLKKLLESAGLIGEVPDSVWRGRFVVNNKAIGSGGHALKYLAPYVSRGCVANWRVSQCDAAARNETGGVTNLETAGLVLQVKRSGTKKYRGQPMSVMEFIRRWLLHVCPSGLHRVRHYGFLNTHSRRSAEELRLLIAAAQGDVHYLADPPADEPSTAAEFTCPICGGRMTSLGYQPPPDRAACLVAAFESRKERAPP